MGTHGWQLAAKPKRPASPFTWELGEALKFLPREPVDE